MNSKEHRLPVKAENRLFEGLEKDKEGKWTGPFYFIQGADCQYGMIDDWEEKSPIGWDEEIRLTRIAVSRINQMQPKPKFFSLCGDMVHAFQGEPDRLPQERDFIEEFSKLDSSIPLVCCCGNHDVGNTPTEDTIRQFRERFGDDYLSFWVGGMKCLVLNSQYYADSSKVENFSEAHSDWLEKQLSAKEECKHLVLFQHIPWFLKSPHEADQYFNLPTDLRLKMLDRFVDAGVKTIFCGHYHRNAGGFYKGMEQVVTSAMGCQIGQSRPGLRVVKVTEDAIKHKYYAMEDIPINLDAEEF